MTDIVRVYTDGACRGNPGPGGWGVLMEYGHHQKELSGADTQTTNNRMELMAAIAALRALKRSCKIIITTDSEYLQKGITEWISKWKCQNWRTTQRRPVKNVDLWQELDALVISHNIEWCWVKGHSGHPGNERADFLANQAIDNLLENK